MAHEPLLGMPLRTDIARRSARHRLAVSSIRGRADRCSEAEILRQAHTIKGSDTEPVDIEFIPGESVADAAWIGVVIIVPALAERE